MPAASGSLEPLGTTTLHFRLSAFQILTATKSHAVVWGVRSGWVQWHCLDGIGDLILGLFWNGQHERGNAGMFELHKGLASTKVAVRWKVNMLFDQILFVSVSISFRIISSSNKNTPIAELFPKTCLSSKNVKYVRVFMTVLYPNNPKNLAKKDPSQKHIDDSALSKVRILYFKSDLKQ